MKKWYNRSIEYNFPSVPLTSMIPLTAVELQERQSYLDKMNNESYDYKCVDDLKKDPPKWAEDLTLPADLLNVTNQLKEINESLDRKRNSWIQTYTCKKFFPTNPAPDNIDIIDIAHALSMQCRFSGHVSEFYSVAQHCVLVSYLCDSDHALSGLLHDASEAYLVDVPRPLKQSGEFGAYIKFENVLQTMIYKKYNCPEIEPPSVKNADRLMLAIEANLLMRPFHKDWSLGDIKIIPFTFEPLNPKQAEELYLNRFLELNKSLSELEKFDVLKDADKYGKR